MDIFYLTLNQMLTMFLFVLVGYVLGKSKLLPDTASLTISRLETYFFVPALSLYGWMENCTVSSLKENAVLLLYGFGVMLLVVGAAYPLSRLFVKKTDDPKQEYLCSIYRYVMTLSNYGFMGNSVILGIWGNAMYFKYSLFTMFFSFLSGSWGIAQLIPKEKGEKMTVMSFLKSIFTVPFIALLLGLVAGILEVKQYMPRFVMTVLADGSACMGPVAMILAGVVMSGFDIGDLLKHKKAYLATLLRLILIPAAVVLALKAIGANQEVLTFALISTATPVGMYTIIFPAAYGGDVETGAALITISTTLSVITLPLMYLLLVVL